MGDNGDKGSGHCGETHRRLGTLPGDLQERLDAVMRGPAEAHLLDAVMSVGRGLDLPQVLRRIVEAAVVVVDAEYGALGVVGEGTRLTQFLPVGITEEQRGAIGPLPEDTASSASWSATPSRCGWWNSPSIRRPTGFRRTTPRCTRSWGFPSGFATGCSAICT